MANFLNRMEDSRYNLLVPTLPGKTIDRYRAVKNFYKLTKALFHRRRPAIVLMTTAVVALLSVTGCKKNRPLNAIIVGASMAPHLVGEHFQLQCEDCQFNFNVNVKLPKQGCFACPNCAFSSVRPPVEISSANHVKVLSGATFKRWDIVAFRREGDSCASVKRIVGLPGETIRIAEGDVFVNSKRIQKSLEVQSELKLPVHDSRFRPSRRVPSRWKADDLTSTGWSRNEIGYHYETDDSPNGFDWLTYHHWRGFHHRGVRTAEFPIEDSYSYNQAINRTLVPVSDLYLSIDLVAVTGDVFAIRLNHRQTVFEFKFRPSQNSMEVKADDRELRVVSLPVLTNVACQLGLTTFDSKLRLEINGECIFEEQLADQVAATDPVTRPFSIGAAGGTLRVTGIQIFRDIYYRSLVDSPSEGYDLDADEFFLLGDNVPVSIDSRHWGKNGVKKQNIFGKLPHTSTNGTVAGVD